jgi:hypothetical protein
MSNHVAAKVNRVYTGTMSDVSLLSSELTFPGSPEGMLVTTRSHEGIIAS